jgi:hypothetical protein
MADITVEYEVDDENPWAVKQLEEFLFFCCPECPDRSSTKAVFINHALIKHPKVLRIIMTLMPCQQVQKKKSVQFTFKKVA